MMCDFVAAPLQANETSYRLQAFDALLGVPAKLNSSLLPEQPACGGRVTVPEDPASIAACYLAICPDGDSWLQNTEPETASHKKLKAELVEYLKKTFAERPEIPDQEKILSDCLYMFENAPTNKLVNEFSKTIIQDKRRLLAILSKKFSKRGFEHLKEDFRKNTDPLFPETRENFKAALMREWVDPLKGRPSLCNPKDLFELVDTVTPQNLIVSSATLKGYQVGSVSNSIHELGHAVSTYFQKYGQDPETRNFSHKVKNCLRAQHAVPSNPNPDFWRDTEEDFSDLIAAIASKREKNFVCSFRACHGESCTDRKYQLSMAQESNRYYYSNDFFRLLHVEMIRRGKLPEVCINIPTVRSANLQNCWEAAATSH